MDNQKCFSTAVSHLHWSAIFAGALVAVGLGFLLNMFGIAIGLSAYSASPDGAPVVAIGGFVGFLIGVIVSMGVAGFVAGYLSRFYHCYCHDGVVYGFLTWSLALMLSAVLLMPVTHYVSFYEGTIARNVTVAQLADTDNKAAATVHQNMPAQKILNTNTPIHEQLAWSSWIVFALFFLGGIASCVGACCGMRCEKRDDDMNDIDNINRVNRGRVNRVE